MIAVDWIPGFSSSVMENFGSRRMQASFSTSASASVELTILADFVGEAKLKILGYGGARFPFDQSLRATDVTIVGMGLKQGDGSTVTPQSGVEYCYATLGVAYKTKVGSTFTYTYTGTNGTEMVTLSPGNAYKPNDAAIIPHRMQLAMIRRGYTMNFAYSGAMSLPASYWENDSTVNSQPFYVADCDKTFAPGTLLWTSGGHKYIETFDPSQPPSQQQVKVHSFDVNLIYKAFGWANFFHATKQEFLPVFVGNNRLRIYEEASWTLM